MKNWLGRISKAFAKKDGESDEFIQKVNEMLNHYRSLYDGDCPYVLNPTLSEKKVKYFEDKANVKLPQDYRNFIIQIGDGGKHKRQFPMSISNAKACLESCINKSSDYAYLSLPFDLEKCSRYFKDDNDDWDDDEITDVDYEKMAIEALQGTIALHDDGCGYYIVLIVTGEHAGELFYIDTCHGQGVHHVSDSFEEYYIKWLDRKITERLAFIEQNDKFDCMITRVKLGGNVRDLEVVKRKNDFKFQFEYFCPHDFIREGEGVSELTQINDKVIISLYMKHVSFSPLEYKIIEDGTPGSPLGQIELVGDRSEHIVVGRVNRLFEHDPEHSGFPIYVEELQQEILIQQLDIPDLKVGDALQIKGRLCGEVYEISR